MEYREAVASLSGSPFFAHSRGLGLILSVSQHPVRLPGEKETQEVFAQVSRV